MAAGRDAWSGRIGFILATVGSAVGIGSIWKFPYEVGANGGSAFILFYLLGLALIVVPLMFAEFAIGRRGRADAPASIAALAAAHGASRRWPIVGTLGVLTGFLILSFYAVIGGWTVAYAVETAIGGLPGDGPQAAQARYDALLASPLRMLAYHAFFMAATAVIVARGIAGGIEAAGKFLMPLLAALMLLLAGYSIAAGDVPATLRFLLHLDPQSLTARAALDALGLGFFSIGVGLGLMITYAAYSGVEINLKEVAVASVVADTAISLPRGNRRLPDRLRPRARPGERAGARVRHAAARLRADAVRHARRRGVLRPAVRRGARLGDLAARARGRAADPALRPAARAGRRDRRRRLLRRGTGDGPVVQRVGGLASARRSCAASSGRRSSICSTT